MCFSKSVTFKTIHDLHVGKSLKKWKDVQGRQEYFTLKVNLQTLV